MSYNEDLLQNYRKQREEIKSKIEMEKSNLKSHQNHRDYSSFVACKERIGNLNANLRGVENKIADLERSIEKGDENYLYSSSTNGIPSNSITSGEITQTLSIEIDVKGTKGQGDEKQQVDIEKSNRITKTSIINNGKIVKEELTQKHNDVSKITDSNKENKFIDVTSNSQEREEMKKFLNEYSKTHSVDTSIKRANITSNKYRDWCNDGRNLKSNNSIYFVRQIEKINRNYQQKIDNNKIKRSKESRNYEKLKPDHIDKKSKFNPNKKRYENKKELMKNFLDEYRKTKSLNQSFKNSGINQNQFKSWINDGESRKNKDAINFVVEFKKIDSILKKQVRTNKQKNKKFSKKQFANNDNLKPSKEKMSEIVEFMVEGKSRVQAAILASVPISQVDTWYYDGINSKNDELINFHNEINRIESYSKRNISEKRKMKVVLDKMRSGKTFMDAAKSVNISQNLIYQWYLDGDKKKNPNATYFYNNINNIPNILEKLEKLPDWDIQNVHNFSFSENRKINENDSFNQQKEKMDQVIGHMMNGYSRSYAAHMVSISPIQVNRWYIEGMNAKNGATIKFYNEIKRIESYIRNNVDEKRKMKVVLDKLKSHKTIPEAAMAVNITPDLIYKWDSDGAKNKNPNAVYFHNNIKKIKNISKEPKASSSRTSKRRNHNKISSFDKNQRINMDKVLDQLINGKNRFKAAKITNIPVLTINKWYSQGKNRHSKNTIYFYNKINEIENNTFKVKNDDAVNSKNEKVLMDSFLEKYQKIGLLNQSLENAGITRTQYDSWCSDGRRNTNNNAEYFVKKLDEINKRLKNQSYKKQIKNELDFNQQKEKMGQVIEYMMNGNSRSRAAHMVSISPIQVNRWYIEGMNAKNGATINFYNEVKRIESYIKDNVNEKRKMKIVLDKVKSGKTFKDAAKVVNISPNLIYQWYLDGSKKKNPNVVYFYNKIKDIPDISEKLKTLPEDDIQKAQNFSFSENQKIKMDSVLNQFENGKNLIEAAKYVNVPTMTVNRWYSQGKESHDKNTTYFFNKVNQIKNDKSKINQRDILVNEMKNEKNHYESMKTVNINKNQNFDSKKDKDSNNAKDYKDMAKIKQNEFNEMGIFLDGLRNGKDEYDSCNLAGIKMSKFDDWIKKGKLGQEKMYIQFLEEYKKINDRSEYIHVRRRNSTKFCSNCGKKIDMDDNFCRYCGYQFKTIKKEKLGIFERIRRIF